MNKKIFIFFLSVSSGILFAASGLSGGAGAASGGGSAGRTFFDDAEFARQLQDAESGCASPVLVQASDVGAFVSQTAEGLKEEFAGRLAVVQSQVEDLQEQVSAQDRQIKVLTAQVLALIAGQKK